MNLNDIRANAYKDGARAGKSGDDKSKEQPFVPSRTERVNDRPTDAGNGKQTFGGVNREVDDIFKNSKKLSRQLNSPGTKTDDELTKKTDILKEGGLLKVPVEEGQNGGKDSVYRRVAKFLLIIGVDEAAKVMQHLTEEQTEKIIPEIASIRSVNSDEASAILSEFQGLMQKARDTGGVDTAREMLEKAYGTKKAQELLNNAVQFPEGKPFEYLNDADSERVFLLLKDESTAVQALVLSRIVPKKAAAVIDQMDTEAKGQVIQRLAKMQPVSPEVLRRVDQSMHEKSLSMTTEKAEIVDGRSALAEILKRMSPASEDEILSSLSGDDPDLGQDMRSRLFTIEDVEMADDRYMQELLRTMAEKDIAYLIAGKTDTFRAKILHNVSTGRGDTILEEEQLHKPMLRRDCDDITNKFLGTMRTAYEQGKCKISGRNDDEYIK
ncbi:MAG: flagellar motor switch protein FliG [Treponema sp.]|nr:flagellar motor switch protein FliG [Treponema sp.]